MSQELTLYAHITGALCTSNYSARAPLDIIGDPEVDGLPDLSESLSSPAFSLTASYRLSYRPLIRSRWKTTDPYTSAA